MSDVLQADAIASEIARYPLWSYDGNVVARTFDRGDFNGSIAFVNAIAAIANRLDHHPDLAVSWSDVTVATSSHDVNGISARDFALIAAIEAFVGAR
jgi:4a-hydroxytetrahydrobiopterin dehydratase